MKMMTWTAALVAGLAVTASAAEKTPLTGVQLLVKNCQACHAKDGTGNPKMLKTLKADAAALNLVDDPSKKKTDAELTAAVTDGVPKTKMASFKKKFSAEQIAGLVAYIRTLQSTPAK